jgi:hypothetical protein
MVIGDTDTTGGANSVTVAVAEFTQPLAVPVTEYTVVAAGATEMEELLAPVLHTYEVAPDADRLAVCPAQMDAPVAATVGSGITATKEVAEVLHPLSV